MPYKRLIKCLICDKEFSPRDCPTDIKSGRGKFCSRKCNWKANTKLPKSFICPSCKKEFPNRYGKISIYCSKVCSSKGMIGKIGNNKGKTASLKTRLKQRRAKLGNHYPKMSLARKGKPTWNKGIGLTKEERRKRLWVDYKEWRLKILERDKYLCQMPNCKNKIHKKLNRLEVHHIKVYSKYPELRLEISNGITLCRKCHLLTKTKEDNFINLFYEIIKFKIKNN